MATDQLWPPRPEWAPTGPTPVQVLAALVYFQTVFHVVLLCGTFQQMTVVSSALAPEPFDSSQLPSCRPKPCLEVQGLIWSSLSLPVCFQQGWREHHTQPTPPQCGPLQYKFSSSGACLWPLLSYFFGSD